MSQARRTGIAAFGSYLPEKILTNAYMESILDTSDKWITERSGIKERRTTAEGETNSDMAANVARQCIEEAGISAEEVDYIIIATVTPDRLLPSTSCFVQAKIGATNAAVFDIVAACSGFIYGLNLGKSLILSGAKNILVLGSECLTSIANWTDRSTCVLFGDGCGGVLLQPWKEGMHELLGIDIGSDGSSAELLTIPAGGQETPLTPELLEQHANKVVMDGRAIFKKAVRKMVQASRNALERSGLPQEALTWLVPHQANKRILISTARNLGIKEENVVIDIEKVGNTSAASVPIALDHARKADNFNKDDVLVMCAFGGGLTWGAALVRW